jgi:hypothetical protein
MAKQRLFPEPEKPEGRKSGTRQDFEHVASKIFSVPKSDIDEREKQWRATKPRHQAKQ